MVSPDVLMISPQCSHGIPRCTEHKLYRVRLNIFIQESTIQSKKEENVDNKGVCVIFLATIERNSDLNLVESEPVMVSKREYSAFQVDVINELKLMALYEEDESLKSSKNHIYLQYCNIVINTSVGAMTNRLR